MDDPLLPFNYGLHLEPATSLTNGVVSSRQAKPTIELMLITATQPIRVLDELTCHMHFQELDYLLVDLRGIISAACQLVKN